MNWQDQLISVYLTVCEFLEQHAPYQFFRVGPNSYPSFTDAETLAIYIFGILENQRTVKAIHSHTQNHLFAWFPQLPTYEGFLFRLNNLNFVLPDFSEYILRHSVFYDEKLNPEKMLVVDSMPIVMSSGFRSQYSKTANEFASQGYCSSKKLYYYGVKFHLIADYRKGTLPAPRLLKTTMAKNLRR